MDQRIESFLGDVLAFAGEEPDAVREGHEGQGGSRLPRAAPRSRSRGVAAPHGNAHRRALEAGAQRHRQAGAMR